MIPRRAERATLAAVVAGFAFGTATHALGWWRWGWAPYRFGPDWANLFWNALVLLDAAVVLLLVGGRRRGGLMLGVVVLLADVAINAWGWRVLGLDAFATAVPVQAGFLGFVLGSLGLLWPGREPIART